MVIYDYILEPLDYDFNRLNKENICFLDIETTGVSREHNLIYLIGLAYYNSINNCWNLVQYFADSKDEEESILKEFNEFIKRFKVIVTYNGESFDIPFIENRLDRYNLKSNLKALKSFDIYKRIKKEGPFLKLENLKLKTVEKHLGIFRDDKYTGKDCINFYYQYLDTKDQEFLNRILKHNYDDLYYLAPIMKIFDIVEDAKSLSIKKDNTEVKVKIIDMAVNGDMFQIYCESNIRGQNRVYYTDDYNFQWIDNKLIVELESKKGMITPTKKCIFVDIFNWPFRENLKDLSPYMTPSNLMLLKVEQKFIMDNIKLIIKEIIASIA